LRRVAGRNAAISFRYSHCLGKVTGLIARKASAAGLRLVSRGDVRMTTEMDDALPTALDSRKKSAEMEAEKASEYMRKREAAEAEKKELLDRLARPSGVSDEERMKRAATIIKRAVSNGLTEVEVGRFPNHHCTDKGRALNQQEPGWEDTLTGCRRSFINSGRSISSRVAIV